MFKYNSMTDVWTIQSAINTAIQSAVSCKTRSMYNNPHNDGVWCNKVFSLI